MKASLLALTKSICIGNSMISSDNLFGINTMSDISKLLYVISRAVRRVKLETILKYHDWYLCQISRINHAIFFYTTTRKKVVIFTYRYFKLS